MKLVEENHNLSIRISLTMLKFSGFWCPDGVTVFQRKLYHCYSVFTFMFILGVYILAQVVELCVVWGDLPLMTGAAFLLLTNLAQCGKMAALCGRRWRVGRAVAAADRVIAAPTDPQARDIARRCDRETSRQQVLYFVLTTVTVLGWATSAEKGQLPLIAWYPYDTKRSPAHELTYIHQVCALMVAAWLNVAKDTLVTALLAQVRCSLQLVTLALSRIHEGMDEDPNSSAPFTVAQERLASDRLRSCVRAHQRALAAARELEHCFSWPTFAQLAVSMVIICVTAFQLAAQTGNLVRFISMGTYLLNMIYQVFIYCYQGNQLSEESLSVAGGAYCCCWYRAAVPLRRALLLLLRRCRRPLVLRAAGVTALSLSSFTAIVKTSYSLFTLLQQFTED